MEVASSTNHTPQFVVLGILIALIVVVVIILRSKTSRIIKYDINTLVTVFFLLGILILVNVIPLIMHQLTLGSLKIPLQGRKDFTLNQRNTISDDTIGILRDLTQDVNVTAFYYTNHPEEAAAKDLFDQYQYYSPHFSYKFIDPLRDPLAAYKYQDELRFVDPTHQTIVPGTVVLEIDAPGQTPPQRRQAVQLPTAGKPGEAEVKLSQALYQLIHNEKRVVYFTEGHGEKTPNTAATNPMTSISNLKDTLGKSQYTLKTVNIYKEAKIPADANGVIVLGPENDFQKNELDILKKYLDGGGRVLMLIDPPKPLPNLQAFLTDYGVQLGNDLVIDPDRGFEHQPAAPMVGEFASNNPITTGYDVEVFFGATRSLNVLPKLPANVKTEWIARTLDEAWALNGIDKGVAGGAISFDPKTDTKGPITVGVATTVKATPSPSPASPSPSASPSPTPEGRMVVYGDSGFATGNMFLLAGNSDLFLRSVNWLAQPDNIHINVRPPMQESKITINDQQRYRIWWISFVLLPGTIAMLGVVVFMLYKPN